MGSVFCHQSPSQSLLPGLPQNTHINPGLLLLVPQTHRGHSKIPLSQNPPNAWSGRSLGHREEIQSMCAHLTFTMTPSPQILTRTHTSQRRLKDVATRSQPQLGLSHQACCPFPSGQETGPTYLLVLQVRGELIALREGT